MVSPGIKINQILTVFTRVCALCVCWLVLSSSATALELAYDRSFTGTYSSLRGLAAGDDGRTYLVADSVSSSFRVFDADGDVINTVDVDRLTSIVWAEGRVFMTGLFGDIYTALDSDVESVSLIIEGPNSAYGIDYYNDQLYVNARVGDAVNIYNGDTYELVSTIDVSSLPVPTAIAVDPTSGKLYITDTNVDKIYTYVEGVGLDVFLEGFRIFDIDVDDSGNVYFFDGDTHMVYVYDSEGNQLATFGEYGTEPGQYKVVRGLDYYDGEVYIADSLTGKIEVLSVILDLTPPDAPASFIAEASESTMTLSWANPESDFASVTIRRSTESFPVSITDGTLVTSNATVETFEQTELEDGVYYYSIFALDDSENRSVAATASATIDTTAPDPASAVVATKSDGNTITVTWSGVLANDNVLIRQGIDGSFSSVAYVSGNASPQVFTELEDGEYEHHIYVLDTAHNMSAASSTNVITIDTTAPDPASAVVATKSDGNTITVAWSGVLANDNVLIRQGIDGSFSSVAYVSGNASPQVFTELEDGEYEHHIYVLDTAHNMSAASSTNVITVDTTAPDSVTDFVAESDDDTVTLTWSSLGSDVESVTVRRDTTSPPISISAGDAVTSNSVLTTLVQSDLDDGTYYYSIFTVDSFGNVGSRATVSVTVEADITEERFLAFGEFRRGDLIFTESNTTVLENPTMGDAGSARLTLNATLKTRGFIIGDVEGETSVVNIRNTSSGLHDTGDVLLANKGVVQLHHTQGVVSINGTLNLGSANGGRGEYYLSGGELSVSTLNIEGSETSTFNWVGGTLSAPRVVGDIVNSGGQFHVSSVKPTHVDGRYTQSASASLVITLGEGTSAFISTLEDTAERDAMLKTVDGSVLAGGISIVFADDFYPESDTTIQLINVASVSGRMTMLTENGFNVFDDITFTLPDLNDELEWDTTSFETTGRISVLSVETALSPTADLLESRPLNYPNPFTLSDGTAIVYELSRDADIDLKIYSAFGAKVYQDTLLSGFVGGSYGKNEVPINRSVVGERWPSGVYFYVLIHDGDIIGKGKLAVAPE